MKMKITNQLTICAHRVKQAKILWGLLKIIAEEEIVLLSRLICITSNKQ